MQAYWSILSLFFYLFLSALGMLYLNKLKSYGGLTVHSYSSKPYVWFLIAFWTIIATFRYVSNWTGGTDAPGYIEAYVNCHNPNLLDDHTLSDIAFYYYNYILRYITSDYHLYFALSYGFIAFAFIYFVTYFSRKENSAIPFIMVFYLYLRGFNTLRSNLAIALLLFSIVMLARSRIKTCILLLIICCLTHKMFFVYGLVIPFLLLFRNRNMNVKLFLIFGAVTYLLAGVFQIWFILFASSQDLGGAYAAYASKSLDSETGFAYVTAFGQILLALFLIVLYRKKVRKESARLMVISHDNRFHLLTLMCYFDFILIPFSYIMGIWRGDECLYLARITMWSYLLGIIFRNRTSSLRRIGSFITFIIFVSWLVFRINRTFEDSNLMPYFFGSIM